MISRRVSKARRITFGYWRFDPSVGGMAKSSSTGAFTTAAARSSRSRRSVRNSNVTERIDYKVSPSVEPLPAEAINQCVRQGFIADPWLQQDGGGSGYPIQASNLAMRNCMSNIKGGKGLHGPDKQQRIVQKDAAGP